MSRFPSLLVACSLLGATTAAVANPVTIRAGTFLQESDALWYPPIQSFIDEVKQLSAADPIEIKMVAAGGKGVPVFELGNAVKTGVLDLVMATGAFFARNVPIADGHKMSTMPVQQERANGIYDFFRPFYAQGLNAYYLGRWGDQVKAHFYLTKKIDKADFTGLSIRTTNFNQAFVEKLGGRGLQIPPAETYTALERGTLNGNGWPLWGIGAWGWEKLTKYRIEPGYYTSEINIVINMNTWNKLSEAQKKVMHTAMQHLEDRFAQMREEVTKKELDFQNKAGIQAIVFEGADREKYLSAAVDTGWADLMQKDPVNAPKLKALFEKSR